MVPKKLTIGAVFLWLPILLVIVSLACNLGGNVPSTEKDIEEEIDLNIDEIIANAEEVAFVNAHLQQYEGDQSFNADISSNDCNPGFTTGDQIVSHELSSGSEDVALQLDNGTTYHFESCGKPDANKELGPGDLPRCCEFDEKNETMVCIQYTVNGFDLSVLEYLTGRTCFESSYTHNTEAILAAVLPVEVQSESAWFNQQ